MPTAQNAVAMGNRQRTLWPHNICHLANGASGPPGRESLTSAQWVGNALEPCLLGTLNLIRGRRSSARNRKARICLRNWVRRMPKCGGQSLPRSFEPQHHGESLRPALAVGCAEFGLTFPEAARRCWAPSVWTAPWKSTNAPEEASLGRPGWSSKLNGMLGQPDSVEITPKSLSMPGQSWPTLGRMRSTSPPNPSQTFGAISVECAKNWAMPNTCCPTSGRARQNTPPPSRIRAILANIGPTLATTASTRPSAGFGTPWGGGDIDRVRQTMARTRASDRSQNGLHQFWGTPGQIDETQK